MATAHDISEWARAEGIDNVGLKGNLSAEVRDAYDAAHPGGSGTAPDYPDGMDDSLFETITAAEPPGDYDSGALADTGEAVPRGTPEPTARARARDLATRLGPGRRRGSRPRPGARGGRKASRPRLPVDDVIASAWRIAAKIAQPLPPLYRVLRIQSPVAGRLLEDAVRGTIVDRVLQPLAQVTQFGEVAAALLIPPAAVTALASPGVQSNPVAAQMLLEMLRHGLMAMMRIGGPKFAEQLAREKEDESAYGATVDQLLALILAPPAASQQEEEEMISDLVTRMSGETVGT
jgi:hypothetical protein